MGGRTAPDDREGLRCPSGRFLSGKAGVLGTSGFQRRWCRRPQYAISTHGCECFDARLAFPGARQTGVVGFCFIDSLSAEIGDPRLDVPGWNQHEDAFIPSADIHPVRSTYFVEIGPPPSRSLPVAAQDDDQRLCYRSLLPAIRRQFFGKADPDELFRGTSPTRSLSTRNRRVDQPVSLRNRRAKVSCCVSSHSNTIWTFRFTLPTRGQLPRRA